MEERSQEVPTLLPTCLILVGSISSSDWVFSVVPPLFVQATVVQPVFLGSGNTFSPCVHLLVIVASQLSAFSNLKVVSFPPVALSALLSLLQLTPCIKFSL